ncbi:hypothetical protein M5D96_001681, partial [Drosophila gunungcola]
KSENKFASDKQWNKGSQLLYKDDTYLALKHLIAIFMQDKKGNGDKINHSLLTATNVVTGSGSKQTGDDGRQPVAAGQGSRLI